MERLPVGVAIKDTGLRYVYANRYLRDLLGSEDWRGKRPIDIYPEEAEKALSDAGGRAAAGENVESALSLEDASRARRRFRVSQFPIPLSDGSVLIGSVLDDITKLTEAEERLAAALEAKEELLKEVYHRVKNNLTTVASLLSLEAAGIDDPRARKAFDECQSRIQSMALVHEALYSSGDLSRLNFGPYLATIAERLVYSSGASLRVNLTIEVENIFLGPEAATPLGLVANELITNSLKYAFPGERRGVLAVRFVRVDSSALFSIEDNGVGLPPEVDPRTTQSLGLQLVRGLARQAGGAIDFSLGAGFRCRITLPLSER
jgi:two-component sensor histidine kinase